MCVTMYSIECNVYRLYESKKFLAHLFTILKHVRGVLSYKVRAKKKGAISGV